MFHFGILASLVGVVSAVTVVGPVADLPIVNKVIAPDGFPRSTVLAGGVFPAPLITGFSNSRFLLNVRDQLTDASMLRSTTIHWHGFFQSHSAWADGPAFVTQCPIAPGNSFLYDFKANGQAGTFWYHSHYRTQYCDGLRGPIVVYDPKDPHRSRYDIDDANTVITLADWYHSVSTQQAIPAVAQATLINGKGRAYDNGTATPLAVINVVKGLRYRLRIVSISCDPNFTFSIDKHSMTIIEIDGQNTQPRTVDSIQIFAGQRYSVVVAANQPINNYWIRAAPNIPSFSNGTFTGGINSAILRYVGARIAEPTSVSTISNPLDENALVPLTNPAAPGPADPNAAEVVKINLALGFNAGQFTINNKSFPNLGPTVPVLLQILSGAQTAQDLLPAGSVYSLPPNKTIQLSLPANVVAPIGGPHPFHLHGHAFSVIRGPGQTGYNFVNPPRRDVVSTGGATDNVTIRFRTDNPGPWFLHCHIDWHLDAGFAVAFAEDPVDVPKSVPVPQSWKQLCPNYDAAVANGIL
jgi:iron transport multicopper oxidase